jgi:hypothetical protein
MLREFLSFLEGTHLFTELPDRVQSAYRIGLAKVLEKKDGPRYSGLPLTEITQNFALAVDGKENYHLEPKAMLLQEQNLRLGELNRLFNDCGIENFGKWLEAHPGTKAFFTEESRMAATIEKELLLLVNYRNDAAHGALTVADLVGYEVLSELADFIVLLCGLLAEKVQKSVLELGVSKKRSRVCGHITEVLKDSSVVVAPVVGDFVIGQVIYLATDAYCVSRTIENIQLQGVDIVEFSTSEVTELGFKLDGRGAKNAKILATLKMMSPDQENGQSSSDKEAANVPQSKKAARWKKPEPRFVPNTRR